MGSYKKIYESWKEDQLKFWKEQSEDISWDKKPQKILDGSKSPFYNWFPDASLNTCYNAIDRHVLSGRGNQIAIIYDSPVTDVKKKLLMNNYKAKSFNFLVRLKN